MRILITNDDGVYSPGIAALAQVASRFGEVDLKLAASSGDGRSGTAGQIGFRRLSRRTNIAGSLRLRSRDGIEGQCADRGGAHPMIGVRVAEG